jgi:phosphatidylserine/phosphatidylglycerophosphate/cardiolipin synthase-like enzyme
VHPPSNEAIFEKLVELWNRYHLWNVVLDHPIESSLGAVVVLLVFILRVWSRLRNNRASLRKLLDQGYSEEKSLICAFGTSICVDDKSSRFAIVSPAVSALCTADELVSVELTKNSKELRHLVIETSNADVRRIDISSLLFEDDRLGEIQGRLMALLKQVKSAQDES